MIAVDFGGAQRPGRDLPGGESLPLPVQTSFCFGFEEVFEEEFDVTLCLRHVEVDRARPRDSGPTATACRSVSYVRSAAATWKKLLEGSNLVCNPDRKNLCAVRTARASWLASYF